MWLLIGLLAGCGSGGDGEGRSGADKPESAGREGVNFAAVRASDGIGWDALAYGVLRADSNTGCIWLEDEEGQPARQLLLEGDYEVAFENEPVTVLRGGEVVAEVGQQVQVGGGNSPTTLGVAGCPVSVGIWLGRFSP